MISLVVGVFLAAIFAFLVFARVRYGSLRVSELPVLLLALLAGSEEKKRLRLILRNRDTAEVPPTMPVTAPPPRPKPRTLTLAEQGRMCPVHDRPQRWDGLTTHPDTTEPAAVDQYAAWLQGYVKRGGRPTHFYDYPFSQADFRYAASTVTVDSDYEYGSSSRHIIVANGVRTERTKPAGPFGGWAHTKCYFMHGYRTSGSIVPVYSDPEFDEFRADRPCDCDEPRSNLRSERPS